MSSVLRTIRCSAQNADSQIRFLSDEGLNGLAFSLQASQGRMKTEFIDNGEPFVIECNLQQSREGFPTEEAARRRYGELQGPAYHDPSARILKREGGNWIDITTPQFLEYITRKPAVRGGLCEW